ncbi:MAG: MATE family efflux transporter [Alphaproteobacteria bacterium]|nr:MATE family efflux transporter [Alphaproteobacteria bacterium]
MTKTAAAAPNPILTAPLPGLMLRLSVPNFLAMGASFLVGIAETAYAGALGTLPLAGLALVFPMVMMLQMMSAGAMGGGVSSAIARAIGAGDEARAQALVFHALTISICAGLAFTLIFLLTGRAIYRFLCGPDAPLDHAMAYSNVIFAGALTVWLCNTLVSIVRGTGNMRAPGATMIAVAFVQIALGAVLTHGLGPVPGFGMAGLAWAQVIAYAGGFAFLAWFLFGGRTRLKPQIAGARLQAGMFKDILKVGAVACISPLQNVATVLVLTAFISSAGAAALAGYGVGARLELLLIPATFAIGGACVPMVGIAIGAGMIERARATAWLGGLFAGALTGVIGLLVAIAPDLWAGLFTRDEAVLDAARTYLRLAGPVFFIFGFGHCVYFAAQGSGKILGPVLAGTLRLAIVLIGGFILTQGGAPSWSLYALAAFAMAAYGLAVAGLVKITKWEK